MVINAPLGGLTRGDAVANIENCREKSPFGRSKEADYDNIFQGS